MWYVLYGIWYVVYGLWHMVYQHKDPTSHDFWCHPYTGSWDQNVRFLCLYCKIPYYPILYYTIYYTILYTILYYTILYSTIL